MNIQQLIGERMKTIRFYSNIKQKDLADKLNIQPSMLSMFEQGKREPSITTLYTFCNFFDITLSQFFSHIDNELNTYDSDKLGLIFKDLSKFVSELEIEKLKKIKNRQNV